MDKISSKAILKPQTSPVKKTEDTEQIVAKKKVVVEEKKEIKKAIGDDTKVAISEKAKELKKELSAAQKAQNIHNKKFGDLEKPGVYFVSGFDWWGAGSVKGNYDGIADMADSVEGAQKFAWDQQEAIVEDIKKRKPDQPIVLVGHSFGGDGVMEIAETLNSIEHGFRKIDLLVTLDSVGYDNDKVPQNVKKNLNYIAQGPYEFLNDGPNIALDYHRTKVENYLRSEEHSDLDDAIDIQMDVLDAIDSVLG